MLKIDFSELKKLADSVGKVSADARDRAIGNGVRKTAKNAEVAAKKELRTTYNVKSDAVSKTLRIRNIGRLTSELSASSSPTDRLRLISFKPSETKTKKGVGVTISRGGGRKRFRHSFIATMKSGHTGVFQRIEGTRKIKEIRTISVRGMFAGHKVADPVQKRIDEQFEKNLQHELTRAMAKVGL